MTSTPGTPAPVWANYRLPLDDGSIAVVEPGAADLPFDPDLWQHNARWFCRLRWFVIGLLAAAGLAGLVPALRDALYVQLNSVWPWLAAGVLTVLNVAYPAWIARRPHHELEAIRHHLLLQILIDLMVLTAVIHWVGRAHPVAPFAYLFHIVLACIFFTARESLFIALAAAGLYLGLLVAESQHLLPALTNPAVVGPVAVGLKSRVFWMAQLLPTLAVCAVIWYLTSRLSQALRHREAELAAVNRRLEAGVEERTRHMLQTTHQLKAPFAAIHANTQLLMGGTCGPLPEAAHEVVARIATRAGMLSQQIVEMLQLANLRSAAQTPPPPTDLDLAEILGSLVARVRPVAGLREIRIDAHLEPSPIAATEDHLRMLLDNLLTNAVNYSFDGGVVEVGCRPDPAGGVRVEVADHGIGIPAEKLPHIFDDYFRTREASRHNKTSTGLGLAIVRDLVRMWRIDLELEVAPGAGTRIKLRIPSQAVVETPAGPHTEHQDR